MSVILSRTLLLSLLKNIARSRLQVAVVASQTRDCKRTISYSSSIFARRNLAKMENITDTIRDQIQTLVVCGPSGSGKTTLLDMLTSHFKGSFKFCVSHTTRGPRKNEQNGKAYHFIDVQTFQKMISNNEFIEYAQFSGNYYGTSYRELEIAKSSHQIPILDVDIRGVMSLKNINFHAKYIFITTPTLEILERNLRMRGTESDEIIQKRIRHAIEDIKIAEKVKFDLVIVNAELEESFQKFKDFVQKDVDKVHGK